MSVLNGEREFYARPNNNYYALISKYIAVE